jgi:hypothetical protein
MTPRRESANKHMQRAGKHNVLGRGRPNPVPRSAPRARVLTGQPAVADANRSATLVHESRRDRKVLLSSR